MSSNIFDFLNESIRGNQPTKTSSERSEGVKAGFVIGFDRAKSAAANKARQLGYESLAKEIESMSVIRK